MRLLIVGTLKGQLTTATKIAMDNGATVTHAEDIELAMRVVRGGKGADLLLVDVAIDIRDLVMRLEAEHIHVPIVACGITNDARAAVAAIHAGAKEYIPLPPDPELIAAVLAGDEAPVRRRRREPPPIPEILGVAPEQVMKALAAVWKEATDRETPSFRQTLEEGVVRVDCDAASGYLAITTEVDTHRAIGVRRDMVSPLVAALTARTLRDTEERLAAGPAKIPAAQR